MVTHFAKTSTEVQDQAALVILLVLIVKFMEMEAIVGATLWRMLSNMIRCQVISKLNHQMGVLFLGKMYVI